MSFFKVEDVAINLDYVVDIMYDVDENELVLVMTKGSLRCHPTQQEVEELERIIGIKW